MKSPVSELFIVDNTDEHWKALEYVSQWCDISSSMDIATGFFEVGALLALEGQWQKVDKIRILIGGDTTRRTTDAIRRATEHLEASFHAARESDLFLTGIDAIVSAIKNEKIEIRVYRKKKFHAKAYITHARNEVVGSAALVGSSNFTKPGLSDNIELNIRVLGREVDDLQIWFEEFWSDAEPCSTEILSVITRHAAAYSPFDVYAKSLRDLVRGVDPSASSFGHRLPHKVVCISRVSKDRGLQSSNGLQSHRSWRGTGSNYRRRLTRRLPMSRTTPGCRTSRLAN